jgi:hypothetical protein
MDQYCWALFKQTHWILITECLRSAVKMKLLLDQSRNIGRGKKQLYSVCLLMHQWYLKSKRGPGQCWGF